MLLVAAQMIRRDLPPEIREGVMDSVAWAAGMLITELSIINADQNMQLIRSLEKKAFEAEVKAKRARNKDKAEGYRQAAQAYHTASEALEATILATDQEFNKVKRRIGKTTPQVRHKASRINDGKPR